MDARVFLVSACFVPVAFLSMVHFVGSSLQARTGIRPVTAGISPTYPAPSLKRSFLFRRAFLLC